MPNEYQQLMAHSINIMQNASTKINFDIPSSSNVEIEVYDINGKIVSTLLNDHLNAGYFTILWDSDMLSSGIYFISFNINDYKTSKKVLLIK